MFGSFQIWFWSSSGTQQFESCCDILLDNGKCLVDGKVKKKKEKGLALGFPFNLV